MLVSLAKMPVIQRNKPPPHKVTFFFMPKHKSPQKDDSGKRIKVELISWSSNPPALSTHAESVSVCKASLPAARVTASETGIEREEGRASTRHQEVR